MIWTKKELLVRKHTQREYTGVFYSHFRYLLRGSTLFGPLHIGHVSVGRSVGVCGSSVVSTDHPFLTRALTCVIMAHTHVIHHDTCDTHVTCIYARADECLFFSEVTERKSVTKKKIVWLIKWSFDKYNKQETDSIYLFWSSV